MPSAVGRADGGVGMGGGCPLSLGGYGGPPQEILKILIQFGALCRNLGALLCKKKQPLKRRSAVVTQFETGGTDIHPEFIQNFLPRFDISIFPSCSFRCLAFLELSTRSVHCAPKENDRPSDF